MFTTKQIQINVLIWKIVECKSIFSFCRHQLKILLIENIIMNSTEYTNFSFIYFAKKHRYYHATFQCQYNVCDWDWMVMSNYKLSFDLNSSFSCNRISSLELAIRWDTEADTNTRAHHWDHWHTHSYLNILYTILM